MFYWTVVAGYACGYVDESLLGHLDRRLVRAKSRQSEPWRSVLVKVVLLLRLVLKLLPCSINYYLESICYQATSKYKRAYLS